MTPIDRKQPRRSISFHVLPEQWEAVAKAHRAASPPPVSSHSMMARNIFEHGLRSLGIWDETPSTAANGRAKLLLAAKGGKAG